MTWKISCGIALLLTLVVVISLFRNKANAQQKDSTVFVPTPPEKAMSTYLGLRNLALTGSSAKNGQPSTIKRDEPWAVLMDQPTGTRTATIAAFADGTASIYISNGGGFLGGSQKYPAIREAGVKMLSASRLVQPKMQITKEFPLPESSDVFFYVVTDKGVYTARMSLEEFKKGTSPFIELYNAAQNVITQYRLNFPKP